MSRRALLTILVALATLVGPARAEVKPPPAASLQRVVEALTAPEMAGRASGTEGGDRAARLIASELAAAGLRPGGEAGTFLQSFPVATGTRLAAPTLMEVVAPAPRRFRLDRDWTPHGGSANADLNAEVVFVGYGLSAPERGWDDYAGRDLQGKIALMLDGTPERLAGDRTSRPLKLLLARARGAAGVLLVGAQLPALTATVTRIALPSASLRPDAADLLLAPTGRTIAGLERVMKRSGAPASFATGVEARLVITLEAYERRAVNVIGILPGADPTLAAEAVVVGGHYDHLGTDDGATYPGADDNASGTAVVLELAKAFAAAGPTARTLIFALFGGEEIGLLGSRYYVGHPAAPMERTIAMVNFDMVGRMNGDRLLVGGVDSGSGLRDLVRDAARDQRIDLDARGAPFAPSDHVGFYDGGAPVLFFHTGRHDDYHQPTDTADKINSDGLARVAAVGARVIERLAAGPRPAYVKLTPAPRGRGPAGTAFFGVVGSPAGSDGVKISRVVPGSAAAHAGVSDGDVIVRFAGTAVSNFTDLQELIRARRPGDDVVVVYLHEGEERVGSGTLKARP